MPEAESGPIEDFAQVRRYIRRVVTRFCPRWPSDDLEEVTQRALLRVMDLAQRQPPQDGFKPAYLSRVAYTHIIDEIRRRRLLVPIETHEAANGELLSRNADPEIDYRLTELQDAIWRCLEKISRNRRHAVALMLLGHKNHEISRLTGWNEKQAENFVTRGRSDLRSCLETKGFTGSGR